MRSPALLLLALGLALPASARPRSTTWEGDFAPATAKEIEKFCDRYTRVQGDLRIGPEWEGADLSGLACVQHIGGNLVVDRAAGLQRVAGLDGLPDGTVLAKVVIKGNPALTEVGGGLPRSRDLVIAENPLLETVAGLPAPVTGGRIVVASNPELRRIEGGRAKTGTRLEAITLTDNARLARVTGFAGVHEVGTLSVTRNQRLSQLDGPPVRRAGAVTVADAFVETLPVLSDLEVARNLTLHALPRLEALPEMPQLSRIGRLFVDGCGELRSVDGLAANRIQRPVLDAAVLRGNGSLPTDRAEQLLRGLARGAAPDDIVLVANGPPAGDVDPGLPGGRR
jgi:hypothetical protein